MNTTAAPCCLTLLLGSCLLACGGEVVAFPLEGDGGTGAAPTVISTVPLDSAAAVAWTSPISATFSKAMDATTIDGTTFTLRQGATLVAGAVTFDDASCTATLTPAATLEPDRLYTATVTTGARDTEGRALVVESVWRFTSTGIEVDESVATAQSVLAPDYALVVDGLTLLIDADDVVQSATGAAALTAGSVTGQRYVVVDAAGLDGYAEIDGAYVASGGAALADAIPAADFALVGADLTTPAVRTLILANVQGGVASYQVFEITFHPAR